MFIFTNSHNLLIPLCSISFETNIYFPRKQNIPLKSVNQALQDLDVRIELSSFNRTFCYSIIHFIVVNIIQNIFDRLLLNLKKNSPLVYLQNHIHSLNVFSHTSICYRFFNMVFMLSNDSIFSTLLELSICQKVKNDTKSLLTK